jgi:hypothetical protein
LRGRLKTAFRVHLAQKVGGLIRQENSNKPLVTYILTAERINRHLMVPSRATYRTWKIIQTSYIIALGLA